MDAGVIALLIPLTAVVGGIFLAALKIWKGDGGSRTSNLEEAKRIEDIYHRLLEMEERAAALETLLLERDRERKEV